MYIGGIDRMNTMGYIINNSGHTIDDLVLLESKDISKVKHKINLKYHNPDRIIGCGILQVADKTDRKKQLCNFKSVSKEINSKRVQDLVESGYLCGEAGHPEGANITTERFKLIDPYSICVRYLNIWMDGPKVMCYFEGTNNTLGETFDRDLRAGLQPAFSLRCMTHTSEGPNKTVIFETFDLITYDYVIFPAEEDTYMVGLIKDSAIDYVKENSSNFKTFQENFDLSQYNIDFANKNQLRLKSTDNTIIVDLEDYLIHEIQNYI